MEVDMNAWRIDPEGESVATPDLSSNGRSEVSRDASMFQPLLEDVMEKCKALNDYSTAHLMFSTATKPLRKLGCPMDLIDVYDDQLAEYFRLRNEEKGLLNMFCDNHGSVINNH